MLSLKRQLCAHQMNIKGDKMSEEIDWDIEEEYELSISKEFTDHLVDVILKLIEQGGCNREQLKQLIVDTAVNYKEIV